MSQSNNLHVPVLLGEVLTVLNPQRGDRYLDLTAGYGGHAGEILERTASAASSVLVDRDTFALDHLTALQTAGSRLIHDDYLHAATTLFEAGETFDLILMDIGVSSPQLDLSERGFSFMHDGPLDMRMDQTAGNSAVDLLKQLTEDNLMQILLKYGEESRSNARKIAHAIKFKRPTTTNGLATVVTMALGGGRGKIHPATKTFQALRLAVNDELGQLERTLPFLPGLLNPGGRVAVISFHSLEDRIVKNFFKEQANAGFEATIRLLTNKPIEGNYRDANLPFYDPNPRARSAKLRAAVKI
jgi:16S rRNA (cytosine1402-N4)-methyltransferase